MRQTGLVLGLCFAVLAAVGCGSSSTAGGTGGSGAGGTMGGSGGASGSNFTAMKPCETEAAYVAGNAITFDMDSDTKYTPKCLKATKGSTVTFTTKGKDFAIHPLKGSTKRGDIADNPIKETTTGTTASFVFDKSGTFPYVCTQHGFLDNGTMMDGIVWVP